MTVFAEEQDVNGENKVEIWVDDCIYWASETCWGLIMW